MTATFAWPIPAGLRVAMIDAYPLAYREAGEGPPLVLIHGSFNDCRTWDAQFAELPAHCRVLAPSLRHCYPEPWDGHGGDFTVDRHASDVSAFIAALKLDRPVVLGHSRGGAVALTFARRHPGQARALVLADPRGLEDLLPPSEQGRRAAGELRDLFARLQHDLRSGDREHAARNFVDGLGGPGAWDRRPAVLKQMFFDNVATAVDTGDAPPLTCAQVSELRMPLLLLTGERSPPRYAEMLRAFAACSSIPVRTVVLPAAGHAMHRDNPAAFNAAVQSFVASL